MSHIKVRFAPSPTGRMHVGNIRTALINFLFAKKEEGEFILRIDNTDTQRSTPEFLQGIFDDLKWLGITHAKTFHQSHHFDRYDFVKEQLIKAGMIYACYETPEELEAKRKILLSRSLPPVYDRAHLKLSAEEKETFEKEGRKPHWRFLLPDRNVQWTDLVRGDFTIHTSTMSDPIVVREDGTYLYTLPSVIDDIDEDISHIFRGEDHIYNTAAQIPIFEAVAEVLNKPLQIQFGHMSFFTGSKGEALSKRLGSISVQDLKQKGIEPFVILSYLRYLGTPLNIELAYSMDELLQSFDMKHFGGNPPKFDPEMLQQLNQKWLSHAPYSWLIQEHIKIKFSKQAWDLIRFNLQNRLEISAWNPVFEHTFIGKKIADDNFYATCLELLPEIWTVDTWDMWTAAIKDRTGRKGKELFMPIRQALTGFDHGPEMKSLLPLLHREWVVSRLSYCKK